MKSELLSVGIGQGSDTVGTADAVADTVMTVSSDSLFVVSAAADTTTAVSADSLFIVPHAAEPVDLLTLTDCLAPYGEPLYPLTAHLSVDTSPLSAGRLPDYTVRGDDAMTLVLLASFVMLVVALGNSWHFIVRQAKDFFAGNSNRDDATETSGELRFQLFLAVITGLLLAIGIFLYTSEDKTAAYVFDNDMMFVGLLFAMSVGYYLMKLVLYKTANAVLFGIKKSLQWKRAFLFVTGIEGVLFFPLVLLQVYFDLSFQKVVICFVSVLFLNKILTFYKGWEIFFKGNGGFVQTFLYFCTLEIAPLLVFAGMLRTVVEEMKIIF